MKKTGRKIALFIILIAGREYMGTVRTTFITDAAHNVVAVIRKVDTKNAGAQLLEVIDSLK